MKTKRLPSNKHKGMVVYCSECKRNFSYTRKKLENGKVVEPICGKKNVSYSKCKFKERHSYKVKVHIPGTGNRQTSKVLDAESYQEAVIKAIEFQNGFESELKEYSFSYNKPKVQRIYLLDAQVAYFYYLDNVGIPEHEQKERSKDYKDQIIRSVKTFNKVIEKNGVKKEIILLSFIKSKHVEMFHVFLSKDSNSTYNKYMSHLKSFFKWSINEYGLKIKNPFEHVQKKHVVFDKETITEKEFNNLLKAITPENGKVVEHYAKSVRFRNYYKPYLKDLLLLALHTGGRREEVIGLKWNMIHKIKNIPSFIAVKNLKVERIKKSDNIAPKIIPITPQLIELLEQLGYEQHVNKDQYIVCPDRQRKTNNTMMHEMTRGFTHFYNMLNTGRDLTFKCLRKTYLSYVNQAMQGDTKSLSSHSNDEVLKKHYIDPTIISKAINKVKIFG